jgi:predicted neuraminidase
MTAFTRRQAMISGGAALACAVLAPGRRAEAAPQAMVRQTQVVSRQRQYYHGWPTLARRAGGQLMLVYSGGREGHVCPFGRVEWICSDDDGATWSWPRVLFDAGIDSRDSGVLETPKGAILVTTFTSLAYEPALARAEKIPPGDKGSWAAETLQRWQAAQRRLSPAQRKAALGVWMLRSTDGGLTWPARYPSLVNSPHGPIVLADGRLLYAGKQLWENQQRVGVCQSPDDGQSWQWLAGIPVRPGDKPTEYHELHAVETTAGRLLVHIRNENAANAQETLQCESSDGGKTWSVPHPIGVWGLPSHLLRLQDGRLLMTYGHRRPPFGNQARLSKDEGRTWSEPLVISGDGGTWDLGYPSTVELADGTLLTAWYESMKDYPRAVLRQARWAIQG